MTEKSRIFISHTKSDKNFTENIASRFRRIGYPVWFDEWEISVGDSIVEKVFEGLQESDKLIVVLSKSSVKSRWVKEELNIAVMRRITEKNIQILPVLIETCDVPIPIKHLRYADFRENIEEGMSNLLEAIIPGHALWKSLSQHFEHFCMLTDNFKDKELGESTATYLVKIHDLLETSLNLRTEIELRNTRQQYDNLNFYEKIGLLIDKGIDIRSQTWKELVIFRANLRHVIANYGSVLDGFVYNIKEQFHQEDSYTGLMNAFDHLKTIMELICFDKWDKESMRKMDSPHRKKYPWDSDQNTNDL